MAKGLGALQDSANKSGGTTFLKLKDGESVVMRILSPVEELITVDEHVIEISPGQWRTFTCLKEEGQPCPLCNEYQDKAKPATYIPYYDVAKKSVGIFKASPTVAASVLALVEEYGDITSRDFKLSRKGLKFDTKYIFLPKDKDQSIPFPAVDVPDIEKMTACKSLENIRKEMSGVVMSDEQFDNDFDNASGAEGSDANTGKGGAEAEDDYPF